jgi:hypothetical protein
MYAMRIFGCWGKMPQQAGTSLNPRLAQLDNGAKRPLVNRKLNKNDEFNNIIQ